MTASRQGAAVGRQPGDGDRQTGGQHRGREVGQLGGDASAGSPSPRSRPASDSIARRYASRSAPTRAATASGRALPAARPTAGRPGRRRRPRASAARARVPTVRPRRRPCRRRRRPAPPVARVGGEWSARPELAPSTASSRLRSRRRAAQPRQQVAAERAGGVVRVEGLDQPVQRADGEVGVAGPGQRRDHRAGLGVGGLVALEVPQARARGRRAGGPRVRRPRSRTGPAGRRPRRGTSAVCGHGVRRPGCARARTRSANRRGERLPDLRDVGRARRRTRRQIVSRSCGAGRDAHRVVGRPLRARSPASSRCGTAAPRRAGRPGRPGWRRRVAGQQRRTGRQLGDLVVVPLDHVGRERQRPEHRVGVGGVPLGDQGARRPRARRRPRAPCRRRRRRAAGRPGRSRGSGRSAASACRSSARTPTSSGLVVSSSSADCGPPSTTSPA